MERKTVPGVMLRLFLIVALIVAFYRVPVEAELKTVEVSSYDGEFWSSSGSSNSWVWVRDTITGAWGEAVVGTGDAIYVARKSSFYRYLHADNSWTVLAAPPNPDAGDAFKTGTALAWDFGDYIYALYGAATGDSRRWFYRYSILGDSWESLADTPYDQGEADAITWVSLDNSIYATIGGEQRPTYFLRYDPSTNTWSDADVADPPAGMGDGASLIWTGGGLLYALRGEFYEDSPTYDFWRYNITFDSWTAMADIPAFPHDGGVGGLGDGGSLLYIGLWLSNQTDFIYALSGNQAYPESPSPIPDNRFYRYTISTDSWERLADLPFGIGYYVGCRLGYADGHIYAWQGTPSTWTGGGDDLARYEFAPLPRTWTVDDDGSADFSSIQEAINSPQVIDGDAIYVYNGTYYENVVVNKTLSLIGENKSATVIDGNGTMNVVEVIANGVTLSGFTLRNAGQHGAGVFLLDSNGSLISENIIKSNYYGIVLDYSYHNEIRNNAVSNNSFFGISLGYSGNNTLRGNSIEGNAYNFGVYGYSLPEYINDIDSSNTVDGKPIYYYVNMENEQVPTDAGHVTLVNSTNIIIKDLNLERNYFSIFLAYTKNSIIENVNVSNSVFGVFFWYSHDNILHNGKTSSSGSGIAMSYSNNNTITANNITLNDQGLSIDDSNNNVIYHNNFINNTRQVYDWSWDFPGTPSINIWDDGYPSGGNYWSDYIGVDEKSGPNQDQPGSDGIGDTPYVIDENNQDRYPLMELWTPPADTTPPVTTISISGVLGDNDWFTSDVTVTLSATEDTEVDKTQYSFDNLTWITYMTPFIVTDEGYVKVYYKSTDKAGNVETIKTETIKIDKTAPAGTIIINDGDVYTTSTSVTITLSASDATSGVARMRFSHDNATWVSWESYSTSKAWTLTTGDETKTVYVQYVDNAGLVSQSYFDTITLDTTPPAIVITSPSPGYEIKSSTITVTWTGSDGTSGVSHYEIKLDDHSWINVGTNTTHTFTGLNDGSHTIEVKAIDNAGLTNHDSLDFIVNTSPLLGPGYTEEAAILVTTIITAIGIALYFFKIRKH